MPAPQHADAHGAQRLVGREGQEVRAKRAHVDGHVGHGLGAVDHHVAALRVHGRGDLLHGKADAQHVGDLGGGADAGLGADLGGNLLVGDDAVLVGVEEDERGTGGTAGLLPGDEVGVVLHDGHADLVSGLEHKRREGLGHQVQALGRVAGEDDVLGQRAAVLVHGADEAGHLLANAADLCRGGHGQAVEAAQRVGVHGLVEAALGV